MKAGDFCRLLLLAAIWGGSFLFMRVAAPAFGAINTAFLRVLFGFIGLVVILAVMRTPRDYQQKFGSSLLLGVINSGLPFLMYCLAARWLPAGYSAILNATTPLMGVVMGGLFFNEAVTLKKGLGVLTGLFGITLLTTTGSAESVPQLLAGVIACLVATGCYAVAGFLTRRWITERGGLDPNWSPLAASWVPRCSCCRSSFTHLRPKRRSIGRSRWSGCACWQSALSVPRGRISCISGLLPTSARCAA